MAFNHKKHKIFDDDESEDIKAPRVNRKFAISVISIFMSILILPTLVWGVLMVVSPSLVEELTFDTGENRNMAKFPDKFNPDTITSDIENWYNDNLPFRSVLYTTQTDLKNSIERPYKEVIFPKLLQLLHPENNDSNDLEAPIDTGRIDETETETLPSFMEGNDETETLPIFIEDDTETETLPIFIDDETETLPIFVEDETETETLPIFVEDETEEDTLPEIDDGYENDDQKNCSHSYLAQVVTKEPTCREYGLGESVCELCNHVKTEYISKLSHDFKVETVAPTCTEFGYDLHTCSACGYEKKSNAVQKLAHDYNINTVAPTCEDYGYDLCTCKVCGYEKQTNPQPKSHSYVVETIAPTCSSFGYDLSTCKLCGYEKQSNAVQKLAHDFKVETIAPTCEDYGYDLNTCKACGYEKQSNAVQKLSHDWQLDREIVATCKNDGEQFYKCSRCKIDAPETVKIAKGHRGPATSTVVEASKLEYGYTLNKCDTCGTLYRANITNRLPDNSYYPLSMFGDKVIDGRGDWLFYGVEGSINYYQATNILTDAQMEDYTAILRELQELCDERGVELRIMIMPNKEQMYSEFMPVLDIKSEYKRVDRLVDYITANSDVEVVYPKQELLDAKPYYRVYYKYDTHWNSAGAFIGTQALYKSLGMEYTTLSCVPYTTALHTGGDLKGMGVDAELCKDDVTYSINYKPEITVKQDPTNSGDNKKATSTSQNDKNFVMLADSFRASMAQFVQKDFANTTLYHRNDFAKVTQEVLDADVLVIAAVERYDSGIFTTARQIIDLYKNNPK